MEVGSEFKELSFAGQTRSEAMLIFEEKPVVIEVVGNMGINNVLEAFAGNACQRNRTIIRWVRTVT